MYSFGKRPPRALESFGVAGILGDECEVYYDTLFTTRHLGRVSDLLSAKLRKVSSDELRLRALLMYTVFEAFSAQVRTDADTPLEEPLTVECGVDEDKVAVGIAFAMPDASPVRTEGLAERISGNQPAGPFEEMLVYLLSHANRVVLRHQAAIRRLEIVSVFGIAGKMDAEALAEPASFELVVIGESPGETPKAAAYVELGDLDYPKLLREDAPGAKAEAPATGIFLAQAADPDHGYRTTVGSLQESSALSDAIRLRGHAAAPEAKTVISGVTQNIKDDVHRVTGVTDRRDDEAIVVQGGTPGDLRDNTRLKVAGTAPAPAATAPAGGTITAAQARVLIDKIKHLQNEIAILESERKQRAFARANDDDEEDDEDETDETEDEEGDEDGGRGARPAIKKIFKKIWPFKKKDDGDGEDGDETEEIAAGGPVKGKGKGKAKPASEDSEDSGPVAAAGPKKAGAGAEKPGTTETEAAADNLVVEIQEGSLDRTIHKAQIEAAEIKKDIGNNKAKKWMDGLMEELVSEKSRLHELAKKLNQAIRQKELEFRNKELSFQDELRRRDDMLRQKGNALTRTKEQLAHATMTMERMKAAGKGSSDEQHYKIKFSQTQKMLVTAREETANLNAKVEELRNQLNSAQFAAAKTRTSGADVQNIQKSLERATRQAEEFKKANQQLLEKLNEKTKERASGTGNDELKKRLEAAMKMATVRKKEAEQLALKVDEKDQETARLKKELAQALEELQKGRGGAAAAPASGKKPGAGGTPPAAAA